MCIFALITKTFPESWQVRGTIREKENAGATFARLYGWHMANTSDALSDTEILFCLTRARQLASGGTGRRVRVAAKASLSDIARACGSTKGTVSKWERGLKVPHGAPAIRYGAVITALTTTIASEVE